MLLHAEYRQRLTVAELAEVRFDHEFRRLAYARLIVGLAGVAVAGVSIGVHWISPMWLALPLIVFVALAYRHSQVDQSLANARRSKAFYQRGLARLEGSWMGGGSQTSYAAEGHLYAADLDLFGKGSLFDLLSVCRTGAGERVLASWLLAPGEIEQVRLRQTAVAELAPKLDLREKLALTGDDIRAAADDRLLAQWGARPIAPFPASARWIALVLAIAAAVTLIGYFAKGWPLSYFLIVLLGEMTLAYHIRPGIEHVVTSAGLPSRELNLLALMLAKIESEPFESPSLRALQEKLRAGGKNATTQILRLGRLVDRMEWARNMFFAPIAAPLLWVPQHAMAVERWRAECGSHVGDWVAAIAEFEALSSLASFTHERPDASFPELIENSSVFDAAALAHPLIEPSRAIANNVRLDSQVRLWLVSGSNMSGKSTLLRAVGTALVLAWAGAPVTCKKIRVSRMKLGASLTTHDSLADNRSRFYAEITRLRDIVNLAKSGEPSLFLLDELLSGTNSHDRRIGAQALVHSLVDRGAIGMVTTHDLALAAMVAEIREAINVHFEDEMRGAEIHFDYRVRPGVIERGNALQLMRAVGLEIPDTEAPLEPPA